MGNGFRMVLEHSQEEKKSAYHHAGTSFACFAMDHDDWTTAFRVWAVWPSCQFVVLLHPLQEETGVKAKVEYSLQVGHVVVRKRKPAHTEVFDGFLRVVVLLFGAKVVDLYHVAVVLLQEVDDVCLSISVHAFEPFGRKAHRDDSVRNVSQVQIVPGNLRTFFICRNALAQEVSATTATAGTLASIPRLLLDVLRVCCTDLPRCPLLWPL